VQGTSPAVFTDSYKLSHKGFMEPGTEVIYSNATARSDKHFVARNLKGYDGKAVVFGLQYFIKDFLIDYWNINFFSQPKEKAVGKFKRTIDAYLGPGAVSMQHFEQLHDLGYLPIRLKSLPEGSRVNMRVPYSTIQNTHKDFAWLTNYLETVWSCETWKPMTTATICYYIRKALNEAAIKTTGSIEGTQFQMHGFEFRGMSGRQDAMVNAAAMLLSTNGTDTIPALPFVEEFYNVDITKEFIATSVPATEHMVACGGSAVRGELESYRKWITEDYPTGIVSLVSDTYDYWKVLSEYLPALKQDIMNRPANALGLSKVVIRPDSGDPYRVICGYDISTEEFSSVKEAREYVYDNWAYDHNDNTEIIKIGDKYYLVLVEFEYTYYSSDIFNVEFIEISKAEAIGSIRTLWEVFGGTINSLGFKVLDSHIGLIYGDSSKTKTN
jgi:nicotinamide phosphoribosyltransferase